ncbi:hypothetical protein [Okeania sp. SIO1I7]|nr:hypothetical protein [Okeania sp. SIO1I7]
MKNNCKHFLRTAAQTAISISYGMLRKQPSAFEHIQAITEVRL